MRRFAKGPQSAVGWRLRRESRLSCYFLIRYLKGGLCRRRLSLFSTGSVLHEATFRFRLLSAYEAAVSGNLPGKLRHASKHSNAKHLWQNPETMTPTSPKAVSVARVKSGLLITFSTGEEGLYSDELLYASLPNAHELLERALENSDLEAAD